MRTYQGFLSNAYEGKTEEGDCPMRSKFLLAAMFVAAVTMILLPTTASALMPTEASPGVHAATITTEDAMTYAAAETATLTTPMKPGATEVTRVDACEAGAAVALTTISAAIPAIYLNTNDAAHMVMKTTTITGSFNGAFADTGYGAHYEVAFAAPRIAGAAIAFA